MIGRNQIDKENYYDPSFTRFLFCYTTELEDLKRPFRIYKLNELLSDFKFYVAVCSFFDVIDFGMILE